VNEISLKSSFIIARIDEYRRLSASTNHREELIGRPAKSLVSVADVPAQAADWTPLLTHPDDDAHGRIFCT